MFFLLFFRFKAMDSMECCPLGWGWVSLTLQIQSVMACETLVWCSLAYCLRRSEVSSEIEILTRFLVIMRTTPLTPNITRIDKIFK